MADYDYDVEPRGVFFVVDNKSFYASVEASMRGWDPLDVCLVVMSEQENTNGGLILATSPEAKRRFNLRANVSRQRDLPEDASIKVVPPRMNLYIKRNLEINNVFRQFVADEDLWPYSIDESILDLTKSWRQFGASPVAVAQVIQYTVYERFGLYVTVGIGENPAQAKIALDIYAKHAENFIGQISYATVSQTIWCIKEMTSVWSIGRRTAEHLRRLGITNMNELAHANPYMLKQEMGMIGAQLFALSWGIDRAELRERVDVKSAGFSNSQVLPRDYDDQHEIELVIKEIGEQLASRLRGHKKLTASVSLSIGFSYGAKERTGRGGFHQQLRLDATNDHEEIVRGLTYLFRKHWHGEAVRNIAVAGANLSAATYWQLNLFVDSEAQEKNTRWTQQLTICGIGLVSRPWCTHGVPKLAGRHLTVRRWLVVTTEETPMIDESRLIYERIEPLFLRQPHTRYWILVADDPYDKQYNFFFNSLKQGHRERSVPLHSVTDYQLAYLEALIAKLRLHTKLTLVFLNFHQQRWPESQRLIERRRHPDEAR